MQYIQITSLRGTSNVNASKLHLNNHAPVSWPNISNIKELSSGLNSYFIKDVEMI